MMSARNAAPIDRGDVLVDLADQCAGRVGMIEPVGDAVDHRAFEGLVIEHGAGEERRRHRIVARRLLRFDADAREQGIVAGESDHPGRRPLRHSHLLDRRRLGRPIYHSGGAG